MASNPHVDLLFVNDGSKDNTLGTLQAMSAKHPQAKYLDLPQNGGKSEAVRQGMLSAHRLGVYDFIGYWDADLSTPLDEVRRMHRYFDDFPYLEMIFGSRLLKLGNEIRRNWFRHYAGRIFATCVSNMLGVEVYDTQCGSKLFRAKVIPDICDEVYVSRWFFDVEILWRFLIKGHALTGTFEMPHKTWIHRDGSKLKFKDFALTFWELFRIRQHYKSRVRAQAK